MFICNISILNKYGKQVLDELLQDLAVDWRELVVMLVLEKMPGTSQSRLIPFLQTDKANVTKILQEMEHKGLIRRCSDAQDQRNKICHLDARGSVLVPQLHERLKQWETACFKGLSPEEISSYHRISHVISQNLTQEQDI